MGLLVAQKGSVLAIRSWGGRKLVRSAGTPDHAKNRRPEKLDEKKRGTNQEERCNC